MFQREDKQYMHLAIRLARRGRGQTAPNPMVGAVVVKNGRIVGQGYHRRPGKEHAEVLALRQAGREAQGATLYVNLEPCCFQGRTPPCTEEILRRGIARVICAQEDPNPRVSGKGLVRLRSEGVPALSGLLETEARELNEVYNKYISTGLPFVVVKIAQTLDGRIATKNGDARWISCLESRRRTHRLRAQAAAVLVGRETVRRDDPRLNVRHVRGHDPIKIIMDSQLRTSLGARVLTGGRTILATREGQDADRIRRYRDRGVEVWGFPPDGDGRVDFRALLEHLGREGITSLLVEGGQRVFTTALRSGQVDKLVIFVAPRLMGMGKGSFGDLGVRRITDTMMIREMKIRRSGSDLFIVGRL